MEELRGSPSPGSRFESSKAQDTPQLTGQTESGIVPGRPRTEIPLLTMIGQGSGGEVYRTCVDQQDVAIKVISSTKTDNLEQIRTEVMETSSKHKFEYVQLYSHAEIAQAVTGEQQLSIRMPFSAGGTLREFIRKYKNEIPLHYQYEYTYQLLLAVENLHVDRRRIHGDIKSENIMVHDLFGEAVRLIDCEGAVPISKGFHYQTGTLHTMSPEMILFDQDDEGVGKVTEKTDIWSAGCVLLEMVLGEYPVYEPECGDFQITHEDKNLAIWYDYFAGRYGTPLPPKIPTDIPLILYSVIDQCLQINPDDRADILQLTGLFESYKNEVTTSSLKCAVMPALGRNLQLGMLYDPFTDTAYPLEDDRINVLENSFLATTAKDAPLKQMPEHCSPGAPYTLNKRHRLTGVSRILRKNLLSGRISPNISGVGYFLLPENSVPYVGTTAYESFLFRYDIMGPEATADLLRNLTTENTNQATHYISRIDYGYDALFVHQYASDISKDFRFTSAAMEITNKNQRLTVFCGDRLRECESFRKFVHENIDDYDWALRALAGAELEDPSDPWHSYVQPVRYYLTELPAFAAVKKQHQALNDWTEKIIRWIDRIDITVCQTKLLPTDFIVTLTEHINMDTAEFLQLLMAFRQHLIQKLDVLTVQNLEKLATIFYDKGSKNFAAIRNWLRKTPPENYSWYNPSNFFGTKHNIILDSTVVSWPKSRTVRIILPLSESFPQSVYFRTLEPAREPLHEKWQTGFDENLDPAQNCFGNDTASDMLVVLEDVEHLMSMDTGNPKSAVDTAYLYGKHFHPKCMENLIKDAIAAGIPVLYVVQVTSSEPRFLEHPDRFRRRTSLKMGGKMHRLPTYYVDLDQPMAYDYPELCGAIGYEIYKSLAVYKGCECPDLCAKNQNQK